MRYYTLKLNFPDTDERARVVQNLLDLKEALDKQVPAKEFNENLLISTWNIRDFDSNKFGHGPRLTESLFYLAEIISHYDLVALQEVSQDLGPLGQLMYILGEDWDFIATDVTEGKSGNRERMAFLYDQKRVTFRKIAGEIVLPGEDLLAGEQQFARTPSPLPFSRVGSVSACAPCTSTMAPIPATGSIAAFARSNRSPSSWPNAMRNTTRT